MRRYTSRTFSNVTRIRNVEQRCKVVCYSASPWRASLSASLSSLSSSLSSLSTPSHLAQLDQSSPTSPSSTFTNGEVIEWTKEDLKQLRHLKNTLSEFAKPFVLKNALLYLHLPATVLSFIFGSGGVDTALALFGFNGVSAILWFGTGETMAVNGTVWNMGGPCSVFLMKKAKADASQYPEMTNVVSKINALEAKRDYVNQQEHEKYLNRKV